MIATKAQWEFGEFFLRMAPVSLPVLAMGLLTCLFLEWSGSFGYGEEIPEKVEGIMRQYAREQDDRRTTRDKVNLVVQGFIALWLVVGLATHAASVGLVGLSVIILATAFCGIIEEHRLGQAFEEALPFAALLTVFFAVVAVIADQQLFTPVIDYVLSLDRSVQGSAFYMANGVLSAVSDNVFVASVYVDEVAKALVNGKSTGIPSICWRWRSTPAPIFPRWPRPTGRRRSCSCSPPPWRRWCGCPTAGW